MKIQAGHGKQTIARDEHWLTAADALTPTTQLNQFML